MKYTREILAPAVKKSASVAGVLRELGLRPAGGTQSHISRLIGALGLDTSHFLGKRVNSGKSHKGGPEKLGWKKVLILREEGHRQVAYRLRRALIESGVAYKCADCGIEGSWNGKELRLQVDHENRNWLDDRKENLRFRCPNCHSQTELWCGSRGLTDTTTAKRYYQEIRAGVAQRQRQ